MSQARLLLLCLLALWLPAEAAVRLKYSLTPRLEEGRMLLRINLEMSGQKTGETVLVLPSAWGNAADLGKSILHLKAESPGVTIAGTTDGAEKTLRGPRQSKIRLSYDLAQDWQGSLRESVRHRVHLSPQFLELNTNNSLVHPRLQQTEEVECVFEWKVPPGWIVATSFGAGSPTQRFRGPWDKVQNAVFLAGDFRLHRSTLGKGTLVFALRGSPSVSDQEIIASITNLIRIEREFWKDGDFPYFLVSVVPFDAGESGRGGSGFTNAFSLHLPVKDSLTPGTLSLVAHEIFHTWNPYRLGSMPTPAETIYWFTEGFSTYYQDLLLFRAGLLPMSGYVESRNRVIRDYFLSPAKNTSLDELVKRVERGGDKGRISYERGALIALWLDHRIREHSHDTATLDSLLFDLFRSANHSRRQAPLLTKERVYEAATRHLSPGDAEQLRTYVEKGTTIELPAQLPGACAVRGMVEQLTFELGMNRTDLVEHRKVSGIVAGSNAQKAGLQDGDLVSATSVYWNDTSKPVRLTVRRGGQTVRAEYFPHGPSLGLIPQYAVASTCPDKK